MITLEIPFTFTWTGSDSRSASLTKAFLSFINPSPSSLIASHVFVYGARALTT